MYNFLVAGVITLCVNFGVWQRYSPFVSVINPRQKRTLYGYYIFLAAINWIVLTVALHIWGQTAAFNYLRFGGIVYAIILSFVNVLVIPGRIREHLFVFGAVLTCNYLLLSVPNYLITVLPVDRITDPLLVVLSAYFTVLLLFFVPLRKLLCSTVEPFLRLESGVYGNMIWFMPVVLFATRFLYLGGEHNTGDIRQLISSMLYIAVIVLICVSMIADCKRIRDHKIMEDQLANQKLYYAELKVRVEEARKEKHDLKHHIAAIRHYVVLDDKEALLRYCDDLSGDMDHRERIPYTGNIVADGVLYNYIRHATKEKINFQYSGTIHSQGIADMDLCVLLGNALDNALTGCRTISEGREIRVISRSEKQLLSIVVRNTFDGKVIQSADGLLSRKRGNRAGVGLSSMHSVVERYGGSMETQWDEQYFTVMFMLPLSENG